MQSRSLDSSLKKRAPNGTTEESLKRLDPSDQDSQFSPSKKDTGPTLNPITLTQTKATDMKTQGTLESRSGSLYEKIKNQIFSWDGWLRNLWPSKNNTGESLSTQNQDPSNGLLSQPDPGPPRKKALEKNLTFKAGDFVRTNSGIPFEARYSIIQPPIGSGGFGSVYKCFCKISRSIR
jgi:hypothetical protein